MKEKRQAELIRIISEQAVETQEQLLALLEQRGYRTTQATISRDIRDLKLAKEAVDGVSRYTRPAERDEHQDRGGRLRSILKNSVTSFDTAQNIVVIKTMPGLASAAAATLDEMEISGFVGSLAGDDTVLLIMRTNQDAQGFLREAKSMLK